jgi:hypothetical protein
MSLHSVEGIIRLSSSTFWSPRSRGLRHCCAVGDRSPSIASSDTTSTPDWIDSNLRVFIISLFLNGSSGRGGGLVFKRIETILLACGCIVATCFFSMTDCLAADIPFPNSMPLKSPPIANYDWSGFYVGGHVGYSRGYGRNTLFDPNQTTASSSFGSLFGGLQFGYNNLLPSRLLVGIEGDISFPNYLDDGIVASRTTPSSAVTEKLDFISTVRGRAGYAFDQWLFYATGGSPGRKRVSWRNLIRPATRTRFCECARAGLWVRALNSPSHRAGLPDWNISTTTWEKPAALFHRAPATNRPRLA